MAPSETVGLRFPADWAEPSVEPAASKVTLASADPGMLFSPQPTYAAGPLLWIAIDHDALIQNLKRAAIPFTIARLHQEAEHQRDKEEESEKEP